MINSFFYIFLIVAIMSLVGAAIGLLEPTPLTLSADIFIVIVWLFLDVKKRVTAHLIKKNQITKH